MVVEYRVCVSFRGIYTDVESVDAGGRVYRRMFDGDRTVHVREVGEYVSNYVRCVHCFLRGIEFPLVGGVDSIGVGLRRSVSIGIGANNIKLRKAQNEFDNDVVLRVAGVFCFFIGSIYNSRGTEIFRQRHGSEHKSTAHFALERVYGVRVEHGGIFVNREDIGVNDERRRSGQRLVVDFH